MYSNNEISKGIAYMWNDIAGLMGEDTSYLVCKTMLRLPLNSPKMTKILSVKGKNLENDFSVTNETSTVAGQVYVELAYQTYKEKEREELKFTIPYQGPIYSRANGEVIPEVKYIYARPVGFYNIAVEVVIALSNTRPQVLRDEDTSFLGEFFTRTLFSIEKTFPEAGEILTVQMRYSLQDQQVSGNMLRICGLQETRVMYTSEKALGEKVITTSQVEPFIESIELTREMSVAGPLSIVNRTLSAKLIDSRNIVIKGDFALQADKITFAPSKIEIEEQDCQQITEKEIESKEEVAVALVESEEETKKIEQVELEKTETVEEVAKEIAKDIVKDIEEVEKDLEEDLELTKSQEEDIEEGVQEVKEGTGQILPRPSKREMLAKHMRDLQGIKNTTETKAFRISGTKKSI